MVYNFDCEWNALQARPAMTRLLLVTFVENVEGVIFKKKCYVLRSALLLLRIL